MNNVLIIYTDGACIKNPGTGGWGYHLEYNGHRKEEFGGEFETTSNRMELTAVIKALEAVKRPCEIIVYSDSQYVINGISKWIYNWKRKNWHNVKNVDLWQQLDALRENHRITWQWVKGHNGNPGNMLADSLANRGAKKTHKLKKKR